MSARLLIVEDQDDLRMILTDLLVSAGHTVDSAATAASALAALQNNSYDALVLDVLLPDLDGFQLCATCRQRGFEGGILMLTARGQVEDRIAGLELGADDYLVKPFDSSELLARLSALLRRVKKTPTPAKLIHFGRVQADFQHAAVHVNGAKVNLASKELQLLRCLIDRPGQVLSRETLLEIVWSKQPFITPRTVDTHIAWLRQKLEADPQNPRHFLTIRGEGYKFEP